MANGYDYSLQAIDRATLTPLVCKVLGSETVEVIDWHCQQLHGGGGSISSVHRFSGTARDHGEAIPWSLVLKAIHAVPDEEDLSGPRHWKCEPLAYQTGLLDDLPGGLAAPRCHAIAEHPGGQVWLWMEYVTDDMGPQWPLAHYGVVARHLGQFNGAYLEGSCVPGSRVLPSHAWLSRGRVFERLTSAEPIMTQLPDLLDHPLGQRACPPDVAQGISRLWEERERFLTGLGRLPQTLCHHDTQRRNLFARRHPDGGEQTVAIDWAWMGTGAIGEDIAPLVAASLDFFEVEYPGAWEFDRIVFEGYLQGLRDAGWRGDPRSPRLGYVTALALAFGVGSAALSVRVCRDESLRVRAVQFFGRSVEEILDHRVEVRRFVLGLADEARELLDEL